MMSGRYAILVFILVLLFCWCEEVEGDVLFFHPPLLDIEEPFIDITANETLDITCFGRYPIYWKLPERNEIVANDTRLSIFNSVNLTRPINKFRSRLILLDLAYTDTGYYSCYYDGTTEFTFRDNVTSLYVFVNDPINLFIEKSSLLKGHMLVVLQQNKKTTIACLPTNSKTNVTLWKTESEVDDGDMVSLGNDVTFDPRDGFVLYYPTIYFSGLFQCRAKLEKQSQEINLTLFYMPDTIREPQPFIDISEALHPMVNGTFTLKCSVNVDPGTRVFFDWSYPNKNSSHINETVAFAMMKTIRDYVHQEVSAYLVVKNVIPSDSGIYRCSVTDHSKKTGTAEVQIYVYASHQLTHVNFTTDIDLTKPVVYQAGQNVKFVIEIHAFSGISEVVLYWLKDGELLPSDSRYQLKTTPNSVKLEINKLSRYDAGIYTLIGKTSNATNNISITLDVKDKPLLRLENTTPVYMSGKKNILQCHANGYPTPVVWWRWKPCKEVHNCQPGSNDGWVDIEFGGVFPNNDNVSYEIYGARNYSAVSFLHLTAYTSGHYMCIGSNVMGQDEIATPFIVSDAKDGFEVSSSNANPIDGDMVTLTCKANVFNFTRVEFKRQFKHSLFTLQNDSSVRYQNYSSAYSHSAVITFRPIHLSHGGFYQCTAFTDKDNVTQRIEISVSAIQKPMFNSTNMNGTAVTKELAALQEFYCYATGVPKPKIMWKKDGSLFDVTNMSGVELIERNQRLILKRVVENDAGFYECIAENRGGKIRANSTLKVFDEDMYLKNGLSSTEVAVIIVFVVIVLIILILSFFLAQRYREERKQKKELDFLNQNTFERGYVDIFNPNLPLEDQIDLLPYKHQFEFPKERLKFGKTLGQGAFGRVVKAEAIGLIKGEASTTVAVKMLKETANSEQRKALIAELKILIHLGRHLNIVNVLGAVTKNLVKGELMVIVEYCCYGNLRHYLLKHKDTYINQLNPITGKLDLKFSNDSGSSYDGAKESAVLYANILGLGMDNPSYGEKFVNYADLSHNQLNSDSGTEVTVISQPTSPSEWYLDPAVVPTTSRRKEKKDSLPECEDTQNGIVLTTCHLLCYAFQCARGMEYLASRKLIHRDLAARNVLLAKDNVVKICDFGLAKDCYKYSNYVKKTDGLLPIKWMAIESIRDRVFTSRSDVWSFGVLLWEIFTMGGNPYPGTEINEEFFKRLKNGYRMEKPDLAPDSIYEIMKDCWHNDPNHRPNFTDLSDRIGSLLEGGVKKYYVELNAPYQVMNEELFNNNDYLQMNKSTGEGYTKMDNLEDPNIDSSVLQNTYDTVSSVRPVCNGSIPKVPLEILPMIQLESMSWNSEPRIIGKSKGALKRSLSLDDGISTGYLSMDTSSENTHSKSDEDDDDSVFLEEIKPEKRPKYMNGFLKREMDTEMCTKC